MRIVLDTNVLISALMFGGNPRIIVEKVICGDVDLYLSEAILTDFSEVLKRPKFGIPLLIVNQIITEVSVIIELVRPLRRINKIKVDTTDNRVLECAVEAKAEYIISGDNHLLELKEYKSIKNVSPQQFLVICEDME